MSSDSISSNQSVNDAHDGLIGVGDIEVPRSSGGNPKLPSMYIMKNHPLHVGDGRALYFIHDGSFDACRRAYELEVHELNIPQGPREEAVALGFLEIFPGDTVFSRSVASASTGLEDMPVMWVTGRGIYTSDQLSRATTARDDVLGARRDRTRGHAVPNIKTGVMEGGTLWERTLKGKFDEKRGRCYPFGCTFQKQRSLYSPCAAGKLSVTSEDTLKMRRNFTEIVLDMAMLSFKQGPTAIVDAVRLNHEVLNTPQIGTPENFAFTSNQLNLAHVKEWDSVESLADNMGEKFGSTHIDQLDSPGHFTNMIALSDLPDGCDPGRFFILYPGIFCTLDNFVSVNFSGLRVHGGSPPIAAENTTKVDLKWATRVTAVSYAKTGPTSTEHKMPLMQIEPDSVLSITPEILRPGKFALDKKMDATTFVTEGPTIMCPSSVVTFLARCLLMLVVTIITQLPKDVDAKVDSDTFLSSFSFVDRHGRRRTVGNWVEGPGWRFAAAVPTSNSPGPVNAELQDTGENGAHAPESNVEDLVNQSDRIATRHMEWTAHQNKCGGHIPSAVCCVAGITPLVGWCPGDPIRKIKPLQFGKAPTKGTDSGSNPKKGAPSALQRTNQGGKVENKAELNSSSSSSEDSDTNNDSYKPPRNTKQYGKNKDTEVGASHPNRYGTRSRSDRGKVVPVTSGSATRGSDAKKVVPGKTHGSDTKKVGPLTSGPPELQTIAVPLPVRPIMMSSLDQAFPASSSVTVPALAKGSSDPLAVAGSLSIDSLFEEGDRTEGGQGLQAVSRSKSTEDVVPLPSTETQSATQPSTKMGLAASVLHSLGRLKPRVENLGEAVSGFIDRSGKRSKLQQSELAGSSSSNAGSSGAGVQVGLGKRRRSSQDALSPHSGVTVHAPDPKRLHVSASRSDDSSENDTDSRKKGKETDGDPLKPRFAVGGLDSSWGTESFFTLQNNLHVSDADTSGLLFDDTDVEEDDVFNFLAHGGSADADAVDDSDGTISSNDGEQVQQIGTTVLDVEQEKLYLRDLPKYLRNLTSKTINNELQQVQTGILSLAVHQNHLDVRDVSTTLTDFQIELNHRPLGQGALVSVQRAWMAMNALELMDNKDTLRLRSIRSCIMTTNCAAWKWLEFTVTGSIYDIVHEEIPITPGWLPKLVQSIWEHILSRDTGVMFSPKQYGIEWIPDRTVVIDFQDYASPRFDDLTAWTKVLSSVAKDIIQVWLEFPTSDNSRWQAIYALNIIETLGPGFLFLDCVWRTYQAANVSLVKSCTLPDRMDITRYPLLQATSLLRQNVDSISQMVNDYTLGRLYRYTDLSVSTTPTVSFASEGLRLATEQRAVHFKQFVKSAFTVIFRDEAIANTKLQGLLERNPDKFSPFREFAPTRRNLTDELSDSPFRPPYLRSVAGVFSALIARGVTFGTSFSRKGQTVFTSPAEFFSAVSGLEKHQYCDEGAYGQNNSNRGDDVVEEYWLKLEQTSWPGLSKKTVSFQDSLEYFFPKPKAKGDRVRFPQLGCLGAYLITADYVYAGVVECPTLETMAQIVHDFHKGPARALEYMGLVPERPRGRLTDTQKATRIRQYAQALEIADQLIKQSIPMDYHAEAGLDLIVTEHTLCKFGRAKNKCDLSV